MHHSSRDSGAENFVVVDLSEGVPDHWGLDNVSDVDERKNRVAGTDRGRTCGPRSRSGKTARKKS